VSRRGSIAAEKISKGELWLPTADKAKFNELVKTLSSTQLTLISELLQSERDGGFHDALAVFSELMNLGNLRFSVGGDILPHEPYGTELHFDWTARIEGEPWPSNKG
jgi:hypothetical protein